MKFTDPGHDVSDLINQGVTRRAPEDICDTAMLEALSAWSARPSPDDPAPQPFAIDRVQYFSIAYDGTADHYWPDARSNWIAEGLVRDFLFRDGICLIDDMAPRVYTVRYKVQALSDTEHLLACPYPTASGNIGGLVMVCINHHLK